MPASSGRRDIPETDHREVETRTASSALSLHVAGKSPHNRKWSQVGIRDCKEKHSLLPCKSHLAAPRQLCAGLFAVLGLQTRWGLQDFSWRKTSGTCLHYKAVFRFFFFFFKVKFPLASLYFLRKLLKPTIHSHGNSPQTFLSHLILRWAGEFNKGKRSLHCTSWNPGIRPKPRGWRTACHHDWDPAAVGVTNRQKSFSPLLLYAGLVFPGHYANTDMKR